VTPSDYEYLRKLLKERSGLDLSADKQYLVESRLLPLARKSSLPGIPELVAKMKGGADALTAEVVEAMTTNETFFFRDKIPFDHLRETISRRWRRRARPAAPCASGARLPPPGRSRTRSRCA
jgi:chemotaxis protein methyltransferase CheR